MYLTNSELMDRIRNFFELYFEHKLIPRINDTKAISFDLKKIIKFPSLLIKLWSLKKTVYIFKNFSKVSFLILYELYLAEQKTVRKLKYQ